MNQDKNYEEYYKEYGSNYFELRTVDKFDENTEEYVLNGVLTELPDFGMTTSWKDGPLKSVSDTVMGIVNSDNVSMVTTILGNESNLYSLDSYTSRVYDNSSTNAITLNFRVYSFEKVGSKKLSSSQAWINNLSIFAQPSVNKNSTLGNIVGNVQKLWKDEDENRSKKVENLITSISNIGNGSIGQSLDDAVESLVLQYNEDEKRYSSTYNAETGFGAKLFKLKLYNWIFKKELICFIENWSYSISKESDMNGKPIYYDFSITCKLDQNYSFEHWMNIFGENGTFISEVYEKNEEKNEELKGILAELTEIYEGKANYITVELIDMISFKTAGKILGEKVGNKWNELISTLSSNYDISNDGGVFNFENMFEEDVEYTSINDDSHTFPAYSFCGIKCKTMGIGLYNELIREINEKLN